MATPRSRRGCGPRWTCCAKNSQSINPGEGEHMSTLHDDAIIIDGLIIAKWDRSIFEDMQRGALTAANCTVSVWEGFGDTVANIADMKKLIRDNSELVSLVRTTGDIAQAKKDGKTGIILGFQNAHAF